MTLLTLYCRLPCLTDERWLGHKNHCSWIVHLQ